MTPRTSTVERRCYGLPENGHNAVAVQLLRKGVANVNSEDTEFGRTPLSWAAGSGHSDVVKELLQISNIDVGTKGQVRSDTIVVGCRERT